jgi:hypothetical protein
LIARSNIASVACPWIVWWALQLCHLNTVDRLVKKIETSFFLFPRYWLLTFVHLLVLFKMRFHASSFVLPALVASVSGASQPTSTYCGAPNAYEVLSGTPWIIFSMNYNYQSIEGSCCTDLYGTSGTGDAQSIHWSSVWDIDPTVNPDVVKGYSFIGLTQNLETTLDSISSIPSTYEWTVSNTSAYKGKPHECQYYSDTC